MPATARPDPAAGGKFTVHVDPDQIDLLRLTGSGNVTPTADPARRRDRPAASRRLDDAERTAARGAAHQPRRYAFRRS